MQKIFIAGLFFSIYIYSFSQNNWKIEFERPKVFIENKGQFDQFTNDQIGEILYAVDFGKTKILFGKKE